MSWEFWAKFGTVILLDFWDLQWEWGSFLPGFWICRNGSISDWLHGDLLMKTNSKPHVHAILTWGQRPHICLDVTILQYIHEYWQHSYVHSGIMSSNILLNTELEAKITNFNMGIKHKIPHNPGYMAPEYLSHGLLTTKTDIYAFGIFLLEILSGHTLVIMKGTKVLLAETKGPLSEASNPTE